MDTYSVNYSREALDDLENIYAYIASVLLAPENAEKQINRIRNVVRALNFMPSRYPLVDWEPWKSRGLRKVPVDNYVIFYITDDDSCAVNVIRIFYGGRDVTNMFGT